ncbi:HAD family hydrolase [Streptomyces sp. NPDC002671]
MTMTLRERIHLIWDWNGTLLQDQQARLEACNESLAAAGLPAIDMDTYRRTYRVPVPDFYAILMGRRLTAVEWQLLDGVYQESYARHLPHYRRLMPGARRALLNWQTAGGTQSLLSLHTHDLLLAEITALGVGSFFRSAEGRLGPTGGTKACAMRRHLQRLGVEPANVIAIGDTLDDAQAAQSCGLAGVILFTGGSQHSENLKAAGVPLAGTLPEAVSMALELRATNSASEPHTAT